MPPAAKKAIEPASTTELKPGTLVTILGARGTYADVKVIHVASTHLEVASAVHTPPYGATLALPWASIFTIQVVG